MTATNYATERKLEVASQYNEEVEVYEARRFSGVGGRFFDTLEKKQVASCLKKCTVLQVGTATGRFTEFLPHQGYEYYGIEIAENMVRSAANRADGDEAHVLRGDGENLPFKQSSFENVLSVRSFHFLPNPGQFVKESFRVLEPNGRLVISFEVLVHLSTLLQALHIMPKPFPSRTYYRISAVATLLRDNGFVVIGTGKVTKLPLMIYKKLPKPLLQIIIRFHDFLPSWFGTIGTVTGEKRGPVLPDSV